MRLLFVKSRAQGTGTSGLREQNRSTNTCQTSVRHFSARKNPLPAGVGTTSPGTQAGIQTPWNVAGKNPLLISLLSPYCRSYCRMRATPRVKTPVWEKETLLEARLDRTNRQETTTRPAIRAGTKVLPGEWDDMISPSRDADGMISPFWNADDTRSSRRRLFA